VDGTLDDQRLFKKTLAAILFGAALVVLCYYFVDRPVAFFVYDQGLPDYPLLKWLTYPPPILQAWTPVVLVALMVRRAFGPLRRWELTVVAACVSLVLADQFRQTISYAFGRDWPETWTHNNPSLIGDDDYGFHPFPDGNDYGSFPSGHTARTLAIATVVWIAYPRWRWACVLGTVAVIVGLIGMDYHFVGDVIAGGFVGSIVGVYTARYSGLFRHAEQGATPDSAAQIVSGGV
jgi:membrane-associated phospholipid phosphatase